MLWKVAARTGGQRLIVRTEERVTGGKVALYFLASGLGDDAAAGVRFARAERMRKRVPETRACRVGVARATV